MQASESPSETCLSLLFVRSYSPIAGDKSYAPPTSPAPAGSRPQSAQAEYPQRGSPCQRTLRRSITTAIRIPEMYVVLTDRTDASERVPERRRTRVPTLRCLSHSPGEMA